MPENAWWTDNDDVLVCLHCNYLLDWFWVKRDIHGDKLLVGLQIDTWLVLCLRGLLIQGVWSLVEPTADRDGCHIWQLWQQSLWLTSWVFDTCSVSHGGKNVRSPRPRPPHTKKTVKVICNLTEISVITHLTSNFTRCPCAAVVCSFLGPVMKRL